MMGVSRYALPHAAGAGGGPAAQVPHPWNRAASGPPHGRERVGDTPSRAAAGSVDQCDAGDVRSPDRFGGHDFGLGGRLAAEQVASVAAVHETFARRAAASLAGQTRVAVEIRTHSVVQITGAEFRGWLPRAALLAGVALDPLPGVALLALDRWAAFALLDLLLGGRGAPSVPARAPSELEHSLLRNRIAGLLPQLRSAWQPLGRIRPRLTFCASGEQAAATPAPAGMVVRAAFRAAVGGTEGELQLAIPCRALKSIRARVPAADPSQPRETAAETGCRAALRAALQGVRVPVSAEVGSAVLPVPRVLALRKGDLIRLDDRAPGAELFLKIGGKRLFRCRPGVVGKRLAVQVVRPLAGAAEAAR